MDEFQPSSRFGIGNGGIQAKFEGWVRVRKLFSVKNSRRASIISIPTTPTTAKTDYSNHLTLLSFIFYISADRDKTMETTTTATAETTASPERTELVTQTPTTRVRPRDQDSTPSGFSTPSRMTRMVSLEPEWRSLSQVWTLVIGNGGV